MKILVISHNSFSKLGNNGKTYESIFSKIKKENISQLYFSQNESPDFDFCDNYFKITDLDVINSLVKCHSKCGGIVRNDNTETSTHLDLKTFNKFKQKSKYLTLARDMLWKFNSWKTKDLNIWLKEFNPDIIFFVGGFSGFSYNIACYVSKLLDKPLVTYFTDDYILYPKNRNFLDRIQRIKMKRVYKNIINKSSKLFVIGDLMANDYTNHFSKQFYPIMNSVPIEPYIDYKKREKITISYFGGLHLERWKMIVRIAQLLDDNTNINVFTIAKPSDEIINEFNRVGIVYCGSVKGDDLKKSMINSDILLHVESDDLYYKSLTRLSVSTKIPEYLMSGRLVLGYGPEEVASMKLLSDNNIGVVLSSKLSDDEIKLQLLNILNDYNEMKKNGYSGYKYVCENFDNEKIATEFIVQLNDVINN